MEMANKTRGDLLYEAQEDNTMTWSELGILAFVASKDQGNTSVQELLKNSTDNAHTITTALKGLVEKGYFKKTKAGYALNLDEY